VALTNGQTRETLANDMWQACKILRRDNNCGGVMEYSERNVAVCGNLMSEDQLGIKGGQPDRMVSLLYNHYHG
jgi:hypothetical protein